MNDVIHRNNCPVCGAAAFTALFSVKDHTVSGKWFEIMECRNCTLRFTQDVPGQDAIGAYYQSDNYISHSDTSRGFINRLYKMVRSVTVRQKRKLAEKITGIKRGAILDIGSGTGFFLSEMQKAGWQVTGLEPSQGARDFAKRNHKIALKDMTELYNLRGGQYDVITLWHVLEHVHDLEVYAKQFNLLLKDHGKLILAVPNYTSHDAAIYKESWAAYDVPRHLYHFSPASMKVLMEANNFVIEKMYPMWFDSFYVSLLSSRYKTGKTKWLHAYITACISNFKAWGRPQKCSSVIYVMRKKN